MQVSLEVTSDLERRLSISVPAEQVQKQVDEQLRRMARSVRIKGFRPGKVPLKIVQMHYGAQAREEAVGRLIQSCYTEAVQEQKLNPAAAPLLDAVKAQDGADLEFTATLEVCPEVKLGSFDQIEVAVPKAQITEADVDKMISELQRQNQSLEEVAQDTPAADGNVVTFDHKGTIDGELFEGGSHEGQRVILGSKGLIDGLEEGMIGMKVGDAKDIEATFPKDYSTESLQGKRAVFAVVIKAIHKTVLPEINDDFCALYGVTEGGIEALRQEVSRNMERELQQSIKKKVKRQVMDGLVATTPLPLPQSTVAEEIERLRKQAVEQLIERGVDKDKIPEIPDSEFTAEAQQRVHLGFIIESVIEKYSLAVPAEKVEAMLRDMASLYQSPEEVINWYKNDKKQLNMVRHLVLEDEVVATVLKEAKVTDSELSYADAVRPGVTGPAASADADQAPAPKKD